ncbi:conserved hypothetical protein [Methanocaldococcus vulcanius M7]|uniref:DUF2666 domain-containing protein n=1 Tax=Methanocaldococcus vulcanius (strain ATCC 700851 / DSM 12094 / M7) TaxID=579137 RepID=C9RDR2_METVM|nr:DUF2666 domain-containing protein [Methanocaldococcus vulcanius]ACX73441.1 conserved hypothetical protein [Methanocaldococcus vulcanius M7]
MENKIEFIAKHGKWFTVKKLKIDENVEDIEIARLLASIDETVLNKIPEYLPFDIEKLNIIADEIFPKKKGRIKEEDIIEALKKLKSPATTRKLNEITTSKEGKEILKILLNSIILERLGIQTRISPKVIEKYIEKERENGH